MTFTASSQSIAESGGSATITAQLSTTSGRSVTVPFTLTGTASESADYTITSSPITISAGSTTQTITVTIVNDSIDESDETVIATMGTPTNADAGTTTVHTLTVTDNDTAGLTFAEEGGSLLLTEGSVITDTFTLVLDSQPTADVTVSVIIDSTQATPDQTSLTFTASNWNQTQTVTLNDVDDDIDEGATHTILVTSSPSSTDNNYSASLNTSLIKTDNITMTDNDTASVSINDGGGIAVTEAGGTDTYSVVLTSEPTLDVTVSLSPNAQVGVGATTALTFTSVNWETPQIVTVSAVDDDVAEGAHAGLVAHTSVSSDTYYSGLTIASATPQITDNDTAGVIITEEAGDSSVTTEGGTDTYTVALTSEPTSSVTISISGNTTLSVSPSILTFTSSNWDTTPQTVTLSYASGSALSGTASHTATSDDANYNAITIASVAVDITEDSDELLANAGSNQTGLLGYGYTLDGSASTGDIQTYAWTISSGTGNLTNATSEAATWTPTAAGSAVITLKVTNADGETSVATVTITAVNADIVSMEEEEESILASNPTDGSLLTYRVVTQIFYIEGEDFTLLLPEADYGSVIIEYCECGDLIIGLPRQNKVLYQQRALSGTIDLTTQSLMESQTYFEVIEKDVDGFGSTIALQDLDEDGTDELLIGSTGGGAYIYSTTDFSELGAITGGDEDAPTSMLVSEEYVAMGPGNYAQDDNLRYEATEEEGSLSISIFRVEGMGTGSQELGDADITVSSGGEDVLILSYIFGDFDGDGLEDLAYSTDDQIIHICLGTTLVEGGEITPDDDDVTITLDGPAYTLNAGDLTGDLIDELIAGNPGYGNDDTGAVYIIFGGTDWEETLAMPNARILVVEGRSSNDRIGSDTLIMDRTGDDVDDLLVITRTSQIYVVDVGEGANEASSLDGDAESFSVSSSGGCSMAKGTPADRPSYLVLLHILFGLVFLKLLWRSACKGNS